MRLGVTSGVSCETSLNEHVTPHLHREQAASGDLTRSPRANASHAQGRHAGGSRTRLGDSASQDYTASVAPGESAAGSTYTLPARREFSKSGCRPWNSQHWYCQHKNTSGEVWHRPGIPVVIRIRVIRGSITCCGLRATLVQEASWRSAVLQRGTQLSGSVANLPCKRRRRL